MGKVLDGYPVVRSDSDLHYTEHFARQQDLSQTIEYGEAYFDNYVKRSGTDIANRINACRTNATEFYCPDGVILDVGIGSGEFILSSKQKCFGYDVNPYGIKWLKDRDLFLDPYTEDLSCVAGISTWDVLEHMADPEVFLSKILAGRFLFVSLPTFEDLVTVKSSKHFKQEHFWYWRPSGLIHFMYDCGFGCVQVSDCETLAGREGITSFVFKKL
jgi:hypothetical protein